MEPIIFDFKVRGDERGSLIAIEEQRDIPFTIRRVYYIFDTQPGVRRGLHAHRQLQQVMMCLHGSCQLLLDDGRERITVTMQNNSRGIMIDRMIWHEMHDFSPGCILLVLASDYYNEGDYIREYDDFQQLTTAEQPE